MDVKSVINDAGKSIMKAIGSEPDSSEQDLLDTLKKEHDEVRDLLEALEEADTAARRRSLVQKIKAALVPHTKAEEKILYAAIIALKDKDARVDGHEGFLEHECAAKTLQRLCSIANATSAEHLAAGKVLKELVEHHIREEENNVWRDAKKHFSDEDRAAMNRRYLAAKARVRIS
jgi:hemerythrin-like domain-containing protein